MSCVTYSDEELARMRNIIHGGCMSGRTVFAAGEIHGKGAVAMRWDDPFMQAAQRLAFADREAFLAFVAELSEVARGREGESHSMTLGRVQGSLSGARYAGGETGGQK